MKNIFILLIDTFKANSKNIVLVSTIISVIIFTLYLYNPNIVDIITKNIDFSKLLIIIGLIISISSLILLLLNLFLNYLDDKTSLTAAKEYQLYIQHELKALKNNNLLNKTNFTENEKSKIIDKLTQQFENSVSDDFTQKIEEKIKIKNLQNRFDISIHRLKEEINSLNRRGNINLFIGMLLSLSGILYLGFTVYSSNIYFTYEALFINLAPRAFFVLFIELFSFFFLNLYKKSLDDIKYYQNEITNLESRYLAIDISKQSNNFKLISNALDIILKTERNFILKKDETTIELEKNKIEAQSSNSTVQALKDIINFKR